VESGSFEIASRRSGNLCSLDIMSNISRSITRIGVWYEIVSPNFIVRFAIIPFPRPGISFTSNGGGESGDDRSSNGVLWVLGIGAVGSKAGDMAIVSATPGEVTIDIPRPLENSLEVWIQ